MISLGFHRGMDYLLSHEATLTYYKRSKIWLTLKHLHSCQPLPPIVPAYAEQSLQGRLIIGPSGLPCPALLGARVRFP